MDKPISTYKGIVDCSVIAEKLQKDYLDLMSLYNRGSSIFCLNTQRRYESGYAFVDKHVSEVLSRFSMPITSIQMFYSDGLWIFPDEIMHQSMHPFNQGYGMLSHSGFHLLDIIWQLYNNGTLPDKKPNNFETLASATYGPGMIKNFNGKDYERAFGKSVNKQSDEFYLENMAKFGELDVFIQFIFKQDDIPISCITANLLHNGFSRRSWSTPRADLYKGNGRVKHQTYIIQQGPFQSIQIHNYQAEHEHDKQDGDHTYLLGGKNHFDIQVFRNANMFPEGEIPVRKYSLKDIDQMYAANSSKLSNELANDS